MCICIERIVACTSCSHLVSTCSHLVFTPAGVNEWWLAYHRWIENPTSFPMPYQRPSENTVSVSSASLKSGMCPMVLRLLVRDFSVASAVARLTVGWQAGNRPRVISKLSCDRVRRGFPPARILAVENVGVCGRVDPSGLASLRCPRLWSRACRPVRRVSARCDVPLLLHLLRVHSPGDQGA